MTVSSTNSSNIYNGDGSTTVFAYTFEILANTDLLVQSKNNTSGIITALTLNTDYTVSNVDVSTGGNVTFTVAPASGTTIIILRNLAFLQQTHYSEFDSFPALAHETALDRLTMEAQQLLEVSNRNLAFDPSINTTSFNATLPGPVANTILGVNATNTGFVFLLPTFTNTYAFPAGTGILVQTSVGVSTAVTLTGTANQITVTNGSGVAGNPTISLPASMILTGKTITGGAYTTPTINGIAISGNTITQIKTTIITGSSTFTPTTGVIFSDIEVQGAGGGSGGASAAGGIGVGAGGGAGGNIKLFGLTPAQLTSIAIVIGAAGTAGTTTTAGGNAASTTATLTGTGSIVMTSVGGNGGATIGSTTSASYPAGGLGGTASFSGTFSGVSSVKGGQNGAYGVALSTTLGVTSGKGGDSASGLGGASVAGVATSIAGNISQGYGAGAGGPIVSGTGSEPGIIGGTARVVITEYISS